MLTLGMQIAASPGMTVQGDNIAQFADCFTCTLPLKSNLSSDRTCINKWILPKLTWKNTMSQFVVNLGDKVNCNYPLK